MMKNGKRSFAFGFVFIMLFSLWTFLVRTVNVAPVGVNGTDVGLSALNTRLFELTGVSMPLYHITDWLGLVPVAVGMAFGVLGLVQLIKRRSLLKVDADILVLGVYYIVVTAGYLIFEMIPINYRPVLIKGYMEASYPSSTTLLVLGVMPTLWEQIDRRADNRNIKLIVKIFTLLFSAFMVMGRLLSGVHWLSDIIGSILLSAGLFCLYRGTVLLCLKGKTERRGSFGI